MVGVEEGREFRFRGDLYSQESTFPQVYAVLQLWLGPHLAAFRYVMCFRFSDAMIFSHNGPHGGMPIPLQQVTSLYSRA